MSVIQKSAGIPWLICLALWGVLMAGCSDPGSRALLKGEKLIRQKQYTKAIAQLETATRLLPRNAQAWNHLGLALHYQKEFARAQQAYLQALAIDHNLASARFNLGNLFFEQNDFPAALDQLTSYTLLQPRSLEAWLKLGSAQLQTRRYDAAERSFKAALELNPASCEALNGLGNVHFHRRRSQDALNYFNRALALDPNYAPAILNGAVLAHHSLNNRQQALRGYRTYLALAPTAQNASAVAAAINQLETELAPPSTTNRAPLLQHASRITYQTSAPIARPPLPPATSSSPVLAPRPTTVPIVAAKPTNRTTQAPAKGLPAQSEVEVTKLPDDLVIRPVQDLGTNARGSESGTNANAPQRGNANIVGVTVGADSSQTSKPPGLLGRVNPKPALSDDVPRYTYLSPPRPAPGNRKEAEKHFAAAVKAQRSGQARAAFAGYQKAVEADPSYFEAHYNQGLAAYDMKNWQESLRAYEHALALRPDSTDARYNFALALRAANYLHDCAQQLNQILQAHPDESRAHFSLGNLYAYKLNQPGLAREHFQKVLQYDPDHAQASEIRLWLANNP